MSDNYIIGVRVDNRTVNAVKFQEVLTKEGCFIKTRLGLHEANEDLCATGGIVILQPFGKKEVIENMVKELNEVEGIKAKLMDLS